MLLWILWFGCLASWGAHAAEVACPPASGDETRQFFLADSVPVLRLKVSEKGQQNLRDEPRQYTTATLVENDSQRFEKVGIKLKGAAGSYRDFDDRPGLTLRMDKSHRGQTFHGMTKFHLNNAVQDETFLSEWLGWQLFQDAGYPAPQVTHVRLWINDRDLGLYVLREGFDEGFLRRTCGRTDGTLYDGGFVQDIDEPLEMDWGDEATRDLTLGRLAAAAASMVPDERFRRLEQIVDLPQFLRFMALERLAGHWDGYSLNLNNYRLFFPTDGRAIFLPHGMDQLFGEPWAGLYDPSPALIGQSVFQHPQWRDAYVQELQQLATHLKDAERWTKRIRHQQQRLALVLADVEPHLAESHRQQVDALLGRLEERAAHLDELLGQGWPHPLDIRPEQRILLSSWSPTPEAEAMELEEIDLDGRDVYGIRRTEPGDVVGSWRHGVVLSRGRYRMEAKILVADVVPIRDDLLRGATLHRHAEAASQRLTGSGSWTLCHDEFEVVEDQRYVEFVLELRAKQGQAWFDRESLTLLRLE